MAFGKTEKIRAIPHVVAGVMLLVLAAPHALADIIIQVDCHNVFSPGGNWNVIPSTSKNSTVSNLKDFSTGATTGVAYAGTGSTSNAGRTDVWNGGAKDWVVNAAGDDGFAASGQTFTITFSGLGTNAWKVELVISHYKSSYVGDYQVGGLFADANYNNSSLPGDTGDDFNAKTNGRDPANWLIWSSVTPSNGAITITATPVSGFALVNAVRLEELTATIPEPTTCALFALGLGAVLTRRRRR